MMAAMSARESATPRTERQHAINSDRREGVLRKDRREAQLRWVAFDEARMLENQVLPGGAGANFVDQRGRENVRFAEDDVVVVALIVARVGVGVAVVPGAVHARVARACPSAKYFVALAEGVVNPDAGLRL